jgi:hypothetical protein
MLSADDRARSIQAIRNCACRKSFSLKSVDLDGRDGTMVG